MEAGDPDMKYVLATLGLILALFVAVYVYVGGYKPVTTEITEKGPFKVVYKEHLGAYHQIGVALEEVEKWAKANGETCQFTFGEYLDNPKLVDEDRLKSNGGCFVSKDWPSGLPEGFHYREIPKRQYLIAVFEGAPSIGPMKVYPKADSIMKDQGYKPDGAVIETYEILSPKSVETRYYFPIAK
jgi:AraC family transcriptional regulator